MITLNEQGQEIENNISQYVKRGFRGVDISLDTSLNEYGLIWKLYKRKTKRGFQKGEYEFIFRDSYGRIDWAGNIHTTTNLKEHYDWVDWNEIIAFTGYNSIVSYFEENSTPHIINDLIAYYGAINVF